MNLYKCWCPDDGDEEDAEDVPVGGPLDEPTAHSPARAMTAAEEFVEKRWPDFDYAEAVRVNVRDPAGVLTEWTVAAHKEVSFSAQRIEARK